MCIHALAPFENKEDYMPLNESLIGQKLNLTLAFSSVSMWAWTLQAPNGSRNYGSWDRRLTKGASGKLSLEIPSEFLANLIIMIENLRNS